MGQAGQDGFPVETGLKITDLYRNFRNVLDVVSRGLWVAVKIAKGNCVYFTTKKILEYAEYDDAVPVVLTLVRHILMQLKEKNYLWVDESRSVRKYVVCSDSPLWRLIKQSGGPEDVFKFLEEVVE